MSSKIKTKVVKSKKTKAKRKKTKPVKIVSSVVRMQGLLEGTIKTPNDNLDYLLGKMREYKAEHRQLVIRSDNLKNELRKLEIRGFELEASFEAYADAISNMDPELKRAKEEIK